MPSDFQRNADAAMEASWQKELERQEKQSRQYIRAGVVAAFPEGPEADSARNIQLNPNGTTVGEESVEEEEVTEERQKTLRAEISEVAKRYGLTDEEKQKLEEEHGL